MENREQIPGNESNKTFQKGSIRPNPTRHNRTNLGGNADVDANEDGEEATEFDSGNAETEINPGQLDREEINLDRTGVDDSQVNGPHNFKSQLDDDQTLEGSDESLSTGSNNRGSSGGAGGAQYGQGANALDPNRSGRSNEEGKRLSEKGNPAADQAQRNGVGGGNDAKIKKAQEENLLGQGGYGTSGTSGTNSGPNQGYQSGLGSAGSQNGSTGYNAGSLGVGAKPNGKDPNMNVEINHRP